MGNNNCFRFTKKLIFYSNNFFFYLSGEYNICEGVKIIATPGHTADDVTVLVDGVFNEEEITIAITGFYSRKNLYKVKK